MASPARIVLSGLALGLVCFATGSAAARGGGGGGGGGHFGGGHFGGGHFLGDGHFGEAHLGGEHIGVSHFGEVGHDFTHNAAGLDRIHTPETFDRHEFARNGFGDRQDWNRWGGHHWDGGWHRWGGWYGSVFWPYFYGDVFSYVLWPDPGYDPFWSYGPDYLLSGIYSSGPYYSVPSDGRYPGYYETVSSSSGPDVLSQAVAAPSSAPGVCGGLAPGVTDLPVDRIIAQAVQPTGDQIKALDDLESAVADATAVVEASCPSLVPLTPLDRLDVVERRIDAMIQAVQIVRAPLAAFYDTLSEGQKGHFLALEMPSSKLRSPSSADPAALCGPHAANFTKLPMDRLERVVQPTAQQEGAFEALKAASVNAVGKVEAACPATAPQTPGERLNAVQMRLVSMAEAVESLRPPLKAFYATLNSDQKARLESS